MRTIRKLFKVEYAHQLDSSFSVGCQNIHGHSAKIEVFLQAVDLIKDGMIIDFGELKKYVEPIIMKYDHAIILPSSIATDNSDYFKSIYMNNKNIIVLPTNPTAENFAEILCREIREVLDMNWEFANQVNITVRFHETETGWAEYQE